MTEVPPYMVHHAIEGLDFVEHESDITIIGSKQSIKPVEDALDLLSGYQQDEVFASLGSIVIADGFCTRAYPQLQVPTFTITPEYLAMSPIEWLASAIVHDAHHIAMYQRILATGKIPGYFDYAGVDAEAECMRLQLAFYQKVRPKGDKNTISYLTEIVMRMPGDIFYLSTEYVDYVNANSDKQFS